MFKKLLILSVLFVGSVQAASAQCIAPVNFTVSYVSLDSIHTAWSSPLDSFQIEYKPAGFVQGTGNMATVHDTVAVFGLKGLTLAPNAQTCQKFDVYIRGFCANGNVSPWGGPFRFRTPNEPPVVPDITITMNSLLCNDSLWPAGKAGFVHTDNLQRDSITNKLVHNIGTLTNFLLNHFLYAKGEKDTVMSYTTPWIDFSNGTKDVVFFVCSKNDTNPTDNVTLNVHLNNGATMHNSIFTYSGNDPEWKKLFIDLGAFAATSDSIRLTFELDQTTALQPEFNDFYLDHIFIGDTSRYMSEDFFDFERTSATEFSVKRVLKTGTEISYQYGPVGFTPGNGQFGSATTKSDSVLFSNVPAGTDWLYIKDSAIHHSNIHQLSAWQGPFFIDSTYTYFTQLTLKADMNQNCINDSGDLAVIDKGWLHPNKVHFTNANGEFLFPIAKGKHKFIIDKPADTLACYPDTIYIDTDSLSSLKQTILVPPHWNSDVYPYAIGPPNIIQGDTASYHFGIKNYSGLLTDSIRVQVYIDPVYFTVVDFPGWTQKTTPGLYEKRTAPIQPMGVLTDSSLKVHANLGAQLMSSITMLHIYIDSTGIVESSYRAKNNFYIVILANFTGYDPNDKQVSPRGYTSDQESILHYRIRFQNTGSYTTSKVVVIDTLPSYLHNANFQLIETSHLCSTEIDSNHVAKFTFYNIQLPDSTTDLEGSKGYIDYAVVLDSPMQIGDSVSSRAYIYFDYNPAVITNDAWVKVIDSCDLYVPEADFVQTTVGYTAQGYQVDFVSAAKNAKYVYWDFGDGTQDTGAQVSHVYKFNNQYTVTQTIVNKCGEQDTATSAMPITGIGMPEFENGGLLVYPNPTNGRLEISCTTTEKLRVQLISATGQLLRSEEMSGGKHTLDLSEISAGNYILQLLTATKKVVGREKIQVVE